MLKPTNFDYKAIFFSDSSDYDNDVDFEHYEEHVMIKPVTFDIDLKKMNHE